MGTGGPSQLLLSAVLCTLAVAQGPDHWAWRAPEEAQGSLDALVAERLRAAGLTPAPAADPHTLVRRLHLDLVGVPPTVEVVDAFVADPSDAAYGALVDRLLASPGFGERMAVPWLDVARFADTNGFSIDDHRDMWAWRDWVIDAFNQNMPYDRFILEQVAGDMMEGADERTRLATGFLRNGMNTHEGGTLPQEYRVIYLADMVDTTASAFLGLTMACAQCHDHPYDPITQEEYYRFYGFFDQAVVKGDGAVNGNTRPYQEVTPPIGGAAAARRAAERRIETLERHRLHPPAMVAARARWERLQRDALVAVDAPTPWSGLARESLKWIWAHGDDSPGTTSLQRTFHLSEDPVRATLVITCDDEAVVRVNGRGAARLDHWQRPLDADVTGLLKVGENTLKVSCRNRGGPAGMVAALALTGGDGRTRHVVTDDRWTVTEGGEAAVIRGSYGADPWGRVLDPLMDRGALDAALLTAEGDRDAQQWRVINEAFQGAEPDMGGHVRAIDGEIKALRRLAETGRPTVMVMKQGKPRVTYVLERGQYDRPDKDRPVTPATPSILPPMGADLPRDRLGLARWLIAEDNPLVARVSVNLIWQSLFGEGLLETPNDLGLRSRRPVQLPLLDALAVRFKADGWDVKGLVRSLVMSETYRRSSRVAADVRERDPQNSLLGRASRRRLSAEVLRDSALSIGGVLGREMGGPCVYPEQPDGLWREVSHFGYAPAFTAQAFYPSLGQGLRRRSLYTFWKRTSPPPAMSAFDAPTREVCTMSRSRTNTPLQALVTLNAPVFVDAARGLAARALRRPGGDVDGRLRWAFRCAVARSPEAWEVSVLRRRLAAARERFAGRPEEAAALLGRGDADDAAERAAWVVVASVILNLDETMTRE